MTFQSFLRLLRERRPSSSSRRTDRKVRRTSRLRVERLENRELLSAVPQIIAVTPVDGSPLAGSPQVGNQPRIAITFNQNIVASDATNVNNYLLFGSHNNVITVDSATYNAGPVQSIVQLTYHDPVTNPPPGDPLFGTLVTDTYTLFVRAGNLHSAVNGIPVGQPSQLAVANAKSSNVSLVNINSTDSSLQAITNYDIGPVSVVSVQVAPILGDGMPDLVVATEHQVRQQNNTFQFQSEIVIVPGKLGGGFSIDPNTYRHLSGIPNNARPGEMVIADLDHQGTLDIAIADSRLVNGVAAGTNDVTVFLSSTGFGATVVGAGNNPIALVATDIRGTGNTDLIVANGNPDGQGNSTINMLFNTTGIGTFSPTQAVLLGTGIPVPTDMVLGDPHAQDAELRGKVVNDNINRADLVLSTRGGVVIMQNLAPNILGPQFDFQLAGGLLPLTGGTNSPAALSVAVGNFSGHTDGFIDIAATDGRNIYIFQDVAGSFSGPAAVKIPTGAQSITKIVARDLHSPLTGQADIVAADEGGDQVVTLLNDPTTHLLNVQNVVVNRDRVGANPLTLVVNDANADGIRDVVTANFGSSDVSVLRGVGNGTFLDSTDLGLTPQNGIQPNPKGIAVADLNNDGIPDIVVVEPNINSVEVILSQLVNGVVSYMAPTSYGVGQNPVALGLGDLNRARDFAVSPTGTPFEDIVVVNQLDSTLSILINNGNGTFTQESVRPKTGPIPTGVALGDYSSDGSMDIAVSHIGTGAIGRGVSVLMNVRDANGRSTASFTNPTEYANTINAGAILTTDFNNDGILDLAVLDQQAAGNIAILKGLGDGTFLQTGLFNAGSFPSSMAVADVNRDNFPDLVVSDNSDGPGQGTGSIAILLNASGNGFNSPTFVISPLFKNVPFQSVIVADVNQDLYPDLVVSTAGTDNNLFTLLGIGDGSFQQPTFPFAVSGGNSAPSYLALLSDPFVRVTTFTTSGTRVAPDLVENGSFEALSLSNEGTTPEKGNMVGCNTFDERNSAGKWSPQTGISSPQSASSVPAPPQGAFSLMLDQPVSYSPFNNPISNSGTHVLYQDFIISPTAQQVNLSFNLFIDNTQASLPPNGVDAYSDTSTNPSLDYILSQNTHSPNQQVRIDIIDPTVDLLSVPAPGQSTGNGILRTIFLTGSQTLFGTSRFGAPPLGYLNIKDLLAEENLDPSVLSLTNLKNATQDRTLRLRIATVNTDGPLIVGVDNVKINEVYSDNEAPVVTGLQLRNPGFGSSGTFGGNTTDPTLVGQVSDAGGPGNVAYVLVDTMFNQPGHVNFQTGPGVYRVSSFDSVGHFQTTLPLDLPSQIVNGQVVPTLIGVKVVSRASDLATGQALSSSQSISFVNQGPNTAAWQAMGPGPIRTGGLGLDYQTVSGRITSIVTDPRDASGNVIYVGTANGGIWKTVDAGVDWTPLTDNLTDSSGSPVSDPIGALAIDPANASTLYAATGVTDHAFDSQPGTGIYKTTDAGLTWHQIAASTFSGARISKITVSDPEADGLTRIYVAVAAGGKGPGLYRSTDGGTTWVNVLNPANMFLHGGGTLGVTDKVTSVASVTDIVIDRLAHDDHDLIVGIGNTGFVDPTIGNAGLSGGVWQSPDNGGTWFQWTGGTTPNVANNTLPSGAGVGKITLAIPETQIQADGIVYALISDASALGSDTARTRGSAVADSLAGTADISGLYKSKNNGNDWTHVMLRQSVPTANNVHDFIDLELSANEGGYVGALVVDPTNANVVYLGGARMNASIPVPPTPNAAPPPPQRALLRIDTSNMRDTTYNDPLRAPGAVPFTNDGDDIDKALAATNQHIYPTNAGGGRYVGEGVFWQDLEQNTTGASDVDNTFLPPFIHALAFDPEGRLLVGTDGGIWRGTNYGFGYDFSNSAGAILHGQTIGTSSGMTFVSLNGNLQISDTNSIAIDPSNPNVVYSSNVGTGWALTNGSLTWSTIGPAPNLFDGTFPDRTQLAKKVLQFAPGTIRVAPVDPTIVQEVINGNFGPNVNPQEGVPTTLYLTNTLASLQAKNTLFDSINGFQALIMQSQDGGQTFNVVDNGLRIGDPISAVPSIAVDPQKIFVVSPTNPNTGAFEDLLIYGTIRVYRSENSTVSWIEDSPSLNDLITATAVGPASNQTFYVGTQGGRVFVTVNNGSDAWPERDSGLPKNTPINNITVDPNNSNIAYAVMGGTGGHVFITTNAGLTWTNISAANSGLPNVPAYALAVDPTPYPDLPVPASPLAPERLYVGTQVGVYTSPDHGKTWTRLGQGLPNVPVRDISFSKSSERLVVGTFGRGVFQISTDRLGAMGLGAAPGLPANPGISSITVTFNHAIDPRTFLPSAVRNFTGPNGPVTVLSIKDLDPATHTVFQINFAPQTSDGTYSFNLSPAITDLNGNPLNQNGNFVNGEDPPDSFNFQFAVNGSDDGRFVTGTFHDLLGRPADITGFLGLLSAVDTARFQTLVSIAQTLEVSNEARGDLIDNLRTGTGYYPKFLHRNAGPSEISFWTQALNQGMTPEQIVAAIVGSDEYFNQAVVGGSDANFIAHLYLDLLSRPADSGGTSFFSQQLAQTEQMARQGVMDVIDHSAEYRADLITAAYKKFLGRTPSATEINIWLGQLQAGMTDETFFANLVGSSEYFAKHSSSNSGWVNAAYVDILGRAADPGGAGTFMAQLAAGMSRGGAALEMLGSLEYRSNLVKADYTKYLGRSADAGGLGFFVGLLQQGASDETLVSIFVSSSEFFTKHQGSATSLKAADLNWVNSAYQVVLNRSADSGGSAFFTGNLATAERTARAGVVQAIVASREYKTNFITTVFQNLLGRNPGAAEINQWFTFLSQPAPGAGQPSLDELFQAAVIGSSEFFSNQKNAQSLTTNAQWLNAAFNKVLGRAPTAAEFNTDLNNVLNGYQPQRLALENAVVGSTEFLQKQVTAIYQTYLRRAPSATELNNGFRQLQSGTGTDETLIGTLLSSNEYFTSPSLGANNNSTWLNQVYIDLFGRNISNDPGAQTFLNDLNAGKTTRAIIVAELLASNEYRNRLITLFYNNYLDRAPGTAELAFWRNQLGTGTTDEKVIAQILSSNEYFSLSHPYP